LDALAVAIVPSGLAVLKLKEEIYMIMIVRQHLLYYLIAFLIIAVLILIPSLFFVCRESTKGVSLSILNGAELTSNLNEYKNIALDNGLAYVVVNRPGKRTTLVIQERQVNDTLLAISYLNDDLDMILLDKPLGHKKGNIYVGMTIEEFYKLFDSDSVKRSYNISDFKHSDIPGYYYCNISFNQGCLNVLIEVDERSGKIEGVDFFISNIHQ